jgi:hypothetical protein
MWNVTLRFVCAAVVAVEKQLSIAYSKCVFVAFGIRHANRMHPAVIYCLSGSNMYLHITP